MNRPFITKLLLIQLFCGILSLSLGAQWGITLNLSQYHDKLYKNIIIAGINVGNLTPEEALSTLETQYISDIFKKEITLTLNKKTFKAPMESFFQDSNLKDVIRTAYDYPSHFTSLEKWLFLLSNTEKRFDIALHFKEKAIYSFADNILSHINGNPSDATISVDTNGTIAITPHLDGYIINKKELINRIKLSLNTHSEATINIQDFAVKKTPARTTSLLESIDTRITSLSTRFTPNTAKATNIMLSVKSINGIFLAPGDIFSFNNAVGDTTAEKGYQYAPVIANSQIAQGLGGGVCQVSSTLYNAVLKTGLYSLDRRPHSKPVSYVPLGLDATISWGSIDYQFKNTLDYPIYIDAYVQKDKVYVDIYSNHALKNKSYEIKTEITETSPFPVQHISSPQLSANIKSPVPNRNRGYIVKVIREIYEQNTLKGTELISVDTY